MSVEVKDKIEGGIEMENIKEVVRRNFEIWAETLKAKDPQKEAILYTENSTFLPTFSPELKRGVQGAKEYFEHFLLKSPEGKVVDEIIQPLGGSYYLHAGMYDFSVGEDGKKETANARFTYVWEKQPNGKWKVLHHHSSELPKGE